MVERTQLLIKASVLASRFAWREDLRPLIADIKRTALVPRSEIYECFLQLHLFAGFPAPLEAMRTLQHVWPAGESDHDAAIWNTLNDLSTVIERGQRLYEKIYRDNAETVRREMLKLSPELAVW